MLFARTADDTVFYVGALLAAVESIDMFAPRMR